jgi:hypothetical protein
MRISFTVIFIFILSISVISLIIVGIINSINKSKSNTTPNNDNNKSVGSTKIIKNKYSPAAYSPAAYSPAAYSPAAYSPAAYSPAAYSPAAYSPAAYSPAPIIRSFPTTESPIIRSFPTTESPITRSFPTTESPIIRSFPTTESPITISFPTTESPITRSFPTTESPIIRSFPTTESPTTTVSLMSNLIFYLSDVNSNLPSSDNTGKYNIENKTYSYLNDKPIKIINGDIVFSGNNYLVITDNSPKDKSISSEFSLCFWAYFNKNGETIFNNEYLSIKIINNKLLVSIQNNIPLFIEQVSTIQLNSLNHYTITLDKNTVKIYVNGYLDKSVPIRITDNSNIIQNTITNRFYIGGNNNNFIQNTSDNNYELFTGILRDIRIYDKVLDETNIQNLYKSYFK